MAKQTGRIETKEELADRSARMAARMAIWNHDMKRLRELEPMNMNVYKLRNDRKVNPAQLIEGLTRYCEALLALGKEITHTEQLHIDLWIEILTAALVREKDWKTATKWLNLFFSLPERYRQRSPQSELTRMEKRLARCKSMLGKL